MVDCGVRRDVPNEIEPVASLDIGAAQKRVHFPGKGAFAVEVANGGWKRKKQLRSRVGRPRRRVRIEKDAPAERLGEIKLKPENLAAIKKGMAAVTKEGGTLAAAFADLPVEAGAKTGSAQVDGAAESNAVLVAFAPFDEPEVALALVAEQGGGGAELGEAAAEILSAWWRGR